MKKRIFALLLCGLLVLPTLPAAKAAFVDVGDSEVSLAATNLQGLGIVSGTSENTFEPDGSLTRAQACALIINSMGLSNQVNTYKQRTVFSDVLPSSWYTGIVNLAYAQGIINGYGNGTFGPDDKVTYGQFATMLLRLLSYTTAQIGSVWPLDYTAFCDNLGLSEDLVLKPNQALTRGQAALLLYRTLNTNSNNSTKPYYTTLEQVASTSEAIVLNNSASYGGTNDLLMVYELSGGAGVAYYEQTVTQAQTLSGSIVTLLLNDRGTVMAVMPQSSSYRDVVVGSAKASGITGADGIVHRVNASAVAIVGDSSYTWGSTGYIQVNNRPGKTVRLFYDNGVVTHVCLTSGAASVNAQIAVARTDSAAGELARSLNASGRYSITKNGAPAGKEDLARYDVAYYDEVSGTLCASDYQLTGYIQSVSPSMDAAQTVTVSGCTVPVLEAAWETLETYRLGDRVTLLLTDDCKVAAAMEPSVVARDMVGVLSTDGRSVTLCGSGLKVSVPEVDADAKLRGTLVRVHTERDSMACFAYSSAGISGRLDMGEWTLGSYQLAPNCSIYEHAGNNLYNGYVYSLAGELGVASTDFNEITWTEVLSPEDVSAYHLNTAGQVDMILLEDVTGNAYEYGKIMRYTGNDGIMTSSSPKAVYNNAATITNGNGQSQKYLFSYTVNSSEKYYGISLHSASASHKEVLSLCQLTRVSGLTAGAFFLDGEKWYATIDGYELPVSQAVQVYVESTGQWLSGADALQMAVAGRTLLDVHYDRTFTTGAQVRVVVVKG